MKDMKKQIDFNNTPALKIFFSYYPAHKKLFLIDIGYRLGVSLCVAAFDAAVHPGE